MGRGQELLDAAREGQNRVVEKLLAQITKRSGPFTSLRRGAGPNVQDDNGYTPLHHACLNGHKDIVRMLLEMGASPCTVDRKGATPLHLAAFKGDAEAVSMLLDHHNPPVNVDQLTNDGESALLIAAQFGFVNVVSQLVAKGADVTLKNNNGDSALDLAAHYGKLSVVRHLLHVRPQLVDQYMCRGMEFTSTPLHRASMNGRKDVVIALIDAGIDPNVRTPKGTPLHEAARYAKASVVRILLNKGADLHAMDSKRKTVYDLLSEYPEEATRKVRNVIREYVNNIASYDSENEDLPPFPVQQDYKDYSPTPMVIKKVSPKLPTKMPCSNAFSNNLRNNDDIKKNNVTNSRFQKFPPSPKNDLKSPVKDSHSAKFRERLNTVNNKKLKMLEAGAPCASMVFNHQDKLISELAEKMNCGDDKVNQVESNDGEIYANLINSYERKRCSTLEKPIVSDAFNSLKKRPKPPPKPAADEFEPGEDDPDSIYANGCIKQDIYENLKNRNISDDDKVKTSNTNEPNEPDVPASYVDMNPLRKLQHQRSTINVCSNSRDDIATYDDVSYVKVYTKLSEKRSSDPTYLEMNRCKTDSVHVRGEPGCLYGSFDYLYIYEINPKSMRGNVHPFIKKKEKATPMPCYCHEDPQKDEKMMKKKHAQLSGSQQFYSCEDIYVSMKNRDELYCSLTNLRRTVKSIDSNDNDQNEYQRLSVDPTAARDPAESDRDLSRPNCLLRKKFGQVKQLLADWN